VFLIINTSRQ